MMPTRKGALVRPSLLFAQVDEVLSGLRSLQGLFEGLSRPRIVRGGEPDRVAQAFERLIPLSVLQKCFPQPQVRVGQLGPRRNGATERRDRVGPPTQDAQRQTELQVGL